jgi:hypothetical protein
VNVLVDPPPGSRVEAKPTTRASLPHRIMNALRRFARFAYDLLSDLF